jgi:hypothetical protein
LNVEVAAVSAAGVSSATPTSGMKSLEVVCDVEVVVKGTSGDVRV